MQLKVYDNSRNYTATVVKLPEPRALPGLDNLVGVNIFGNQVLVSKKETLGTLGVFFPVETALSFDYLSKNNLYRHAENNAEKSLKGMFDDNGRVRAQKFRGHASTGFWMPLASLSFCCDAVRLREGDEFNAIDGVEICRKYIPKHQKQSTGAQAKPEAKLRDMVDVRCFREHEDTEHLLRNLHKLDLNDRISVTVKLHGTSLRVGNTLVYRELSWWERALKKLGIQIQETEYRYVCASRKVIKSIDFEGLEGKRHFYAEDLWTKAGQQFAGKLHKGETVYAEVIGWQGDSPIQKGYTYGIPQGRFEVYVYRITRTTPDGIVQDLPFPLVEQRCAEMGVKNVPLEFYGKIKDWVYAYAGDNGDPDWRKDFEGSVQCYLDEPSRFNTDDWQAVEEGIVVQVEKLGVFDYYKAKSPEFLRHESSLLDKAEEADLETAEAV